MEFGRNIYKSKHHHTRTWQIFHVYIFEVKESERKTAGGWVSSIHMLTITMKEIYILYSSQNFFEVFC